MPETKLFDCFIFNDELDLLELRLETAAPYVDTFVLVEAARTFSGAGKPLHFAENRDRFSRWKDKLRHVVVDDMPPTNGKDRWAAEVHQRNALMRGLDDAAPEDVVIVSDADEVLHPEVLITLRRGCADLTGLEMRRTFRYANWELPPSRFAHAVRAMPFTELRDPHRQRNHVAPGRLVRDAGRHFTTLGEVDDLVTKFETYSHSEMDNNRQKAPDYLTRAQQMGLDVFSRSLVTVVSASELCPIQTAFLRMRPDLFDFGELPPRHHREQFRWYARWRARQPRESSLVPALDHGYDSKQWRIRAIAGMELTRHAVFSAPRRRAGTVKRRFVDA